MRRRSIAIVLRDPELSSQHMLVLQQLSNEWRCICTLRNSSPLQTELELTLLCSTAVGDDPNLVPCVPDSSLDLFFGRLVAFCRQNQSSVLLLLHTVVEPTQARKDKHAQYKCGYPERDLAAPKTKTDHRYKPQRSSRGNAEHKAIASEDGPPTNK